MGKIQKLLDAYTSGSVTKKHDTVHQVYQKEEQRLLVKFSPYFFNIGKTAHQIAQTYFDTVLKTGLTTVYIRTRAGELSGIHPSPVVNKSLAVARGR